MFQKVCRKLSEFVGNFGPDSMSFLTCNPCRKLLRISARTSAEVERYSPVQSGLGQDFFHSPCLHQVLLFPFFFLGLAFIAEASNNDNERHYSSFPSFYVLAL